MMTKRNDSTFSTLQLTELVKQVTALKTRFDQQVGSHHEEIHATQERMINNVKLINAEMTRCFQILSQLTRIAPSSDAENQIKTIVTTISNNDLLVLKNNWDIYINSIKTSDIEDITKELNSLKEKIDKVEATSAMTPEIKLVFTQAKEQLTKLYSALEQVKKHEIAKPKVQLLCDKACRDFAMLKERLSNAGYDTANVNLKVPQKDTKTEVKADAKKAEGTQSYQNNQSVTFAAKPAAKAIETNQHATNKSTLQQKGKK